LCGGFAFAVLLQWPTRNPARYQPPESPKSVEP
jgi:hypothetical protein